MGYYRISFETFSNLLLKLTLFFQSHCVNLVRPQVEIRKIVAIVNYMLAHGNSATHMADQFNVRTSTIGKYVDIECDVSCDKNKLFDKYISIPSSDRKIIDHFHDLASLPNICGAINGTHISLASLPDKRMTFVVSDFFNRKKIHIIVMQAICNVNKKF
jgi:hypothetical protein